MTLTDIINIGVDAQYEPTIINEETDTQVLLREIDENLFIAFAPTTNWEDIKTDMMAWYHNGIHSGFERAYESIKIHIGLKIAEIMPERIIYTGHSLGGALAQLATWDYERPSIAITTGSPKPFRLPKKTKMNGSIYNFTVAGDIVPFLPFWGRPISDKYESGKWRLRDYFGASVDNHRQQRYRELIGSYKLDGIIEKCPIIEW